MKYVVTRKGNLTFRVEEDETCEEYFVRYDIFADKFKCSCKFNVTTELNCKHIKFVKRFIVFGKSIFYDNRVLKEKVLRDDELGK